MILVEFLKKPRHDGGPVEGGAGAYVESPAIFLYNGHFIVIHIDDLTMPPQKGGFLLFQIFRIYRDIFLFSGQDEKFFGKVSNLLRFILTFAPYLLFRTEINADR